MHDGKTSTYCKFVLSATGNHNDEIVVDYTHQFSINDWHSIVKYSFEHGITPYLYQRLKQRSLTAHIPKFALDEMRRCIQDTLVKNSRRFYALKIALDSFNKNNIPVIVLKGAYLAEHVYGGLGMRPMCDVDILARKDDLDRLDDVFKQIGFIPDKANKNIADSTTATAIKYIHPKYFTSIDLHFSIDNLLFSIDLDGLWQRSQSVLISGVETQTLSLEDHLNHICYHTAFRHLFNQLKHLVDINLFIETFSEEIDWDRVYRVANDWGNLHNLSLILDVLNRLTGLEIPVKIQNKLPDDRHRTRAVTWAIDQILTDSGDYLVQYSFPANIFAIPTWNARFRYIWQIMTVRPQSMKDNSDRYTLRRYGYFLVRFKFLSVKFIILVWNSLCHIRELMLLFRTKRWLTER
ncbi:MAG: nucleotidyltransferase family protein [Candidatus Hatepunaea meridiana]|nr:nucleotidyltransferase family protein [Candidatus Hatepunaea meridiana]